MRFKQGDMGLCGEVCAKSIRPCVDAIVGECFGALNCQRASWTLVCITKADLNQLCLAASKREKLALLQAPQYRNRRTEIARSQAHFYSGYCALAIAIS